MAARHEITKKFARGYARAAKKDKGRMLPDVRRARGSDGLVAGQRPPGDRGGGRRQLVVAVT